MGYALRAFIMRLNHFGYLASMIGDTNVPRIGENDIVIINSSSGETPSIKLLSKQAKEVGSKLCLITANKDSSISKLADLTVTYDTPSSGQLMKTYHEQLTWVLFDCISQRIFDKAALVKSSVEKNHSILE